MRCIEIKQNKIIIPSFNEKKKCFYSISPNGGKKKKEQYAYQIKHNIVPLHQSKQPFQVLR